MIKIQNINYSYPNSKDLVISNFSLTIKKGEALLLCGESGCGKTTIMRLINGLIPHYYEGELSGSVHVNHMDISKSNIYKTLGLIGSVFQNPRSQFFCVDTKSEVAFGCENMGLSKASIIERVNCAAKEMNIFSLMERSLFNLSGGEKQRIASASIAAMLPEIIVLDEPTSNLDTTTIKLLKNLIQIWKNQGKTIVISEHRLYWLSDICDRVVYMRQGSIELDCPMNDFVSMGTDKHQTMGLRPITLKDLTLKNTNFQTSKEHLLLENFIFSYKNFEGQALNIENLKVPTGEIIAIIGHNGSGKSTFAHCLCGIEQRCRGILHGVEGKKKRKQRLKNSYMVMQDVNHQLFTESVLDEILLSMEKPNETKADLILHNLNLLTVKKRHPMSLSGGQKQRVAIASAIASNRDIIIFDEPTSGLDLRHMKEVASILKSLSSNKKNVFIITHDIDLITECCTHILHLDQGNIIDNYSLNSDTLHTLKLFFVNSD
jgi:energy-coupling factor transport system ATP-binding protein